MTGAARDSQVIQSLRADQPARRRDWGDKAWNLRRLAELGVAVPPSVVVPVDHPVPSATEVRRALRAVVGGSPPRLPLAVRSSVTGEDTATQSLAGSFTTVLGAMTPTEVVAAIETVRDSGGDRPTGVILQRLVDCAFAGVLFSAHPLSYDRARLVLAGTRGRADQLVAGRVAGEYAELPRAGDLPQPVVAMFAGLVAQVSELREICLRVEAAWATPVDLEWAVETGTGRVWILQARPIVLPGRAEVELSSLDRVDSLPHVVAEHPKLALRRSALRAGVAMSRAAALVVHSVDDAGRPRFTPSPHAAGLSVVLLWPDTVDNGVVREFAPAHPGDAESLIGRQGRRTIRRYPRYPDLATTVAAVAGRGLRVCWAPVCLVQEIYDASWTGILRRTGDGYLVEIAQGHFVPKGVVATARYSMDERLRIVSRHCPEQVTAYRFANGHVLHEQRPADHQPTDAQLVDGVTQLLPILDLVEDGTLEFGLLEDADRIAAYLIDVAESDRAAGSFDTALIDTGVISAGRARGHARVVRTAEAALDTHLHDLLHGGDHIVNVVFLAEWAATDLLPLVYRCGPGCGFVFGSGSVLGHVGVVLRECGVPAAVVGPRRWDELAASGAAMMLRLDALTPGVPAAARVSVEPSTG